MKLTNFGKSVLYKIYSFLVYLIPMLTLFFINLDNYTTDSRLSFFGIIVLGFVLIAFCGTIKKIINYNLGLTINAIIFIIAIFAEYLGKGLMLISFVSFLGNLFAMFFGAIANTYYRLAFITDEKGRRRKDTSEGLPLKEVWRETIMCFGSKE